MNPGISWLHPLARRLGVPEALVPLLPFALIVGAVAVLLAVGGRLLAAHRRVARRTLAFWAFVSPWLFGFLLFTAGPMIYLVYVSFTHWDLVSPAQWAGLDNYRTALHDPLLRKALEVTLIYAVTSVPAQVILAFLVALLLNTKIPGISVFRTIWYLPSLVTGVAQIVLFLWVFNPQYGLINVMLGKVGVNGPSWFNSPTWALPAVVLMSLWTIGNTMVIYLAGLQDVPRHLYEAAELDGAGWLRQTWNVTVPQMSPIIFFNALTGLIGAMQIFTQGFVATQSGVGPKNSLLFFVLYLYQNAFDNFRMGYASALVWIFFVIIIAMTMLLIRSSAFWVHYEVTQRERRPRRWSAAGRKKAETA